MSNGRIKGFSVGAMGSGADKTTVTLVILAAHYVRKASIQL